MGTILYEVTYTPRRGIIYKYELILVGSVNGLPIMDLIKTAEVDGFVKAREPERFASLKAVFDCIAFETLNKEN